jgi:hypothetical protein
VLSLSGASVPPPSSLVSRALLATEQQRHKQEGDFWYAHVVVQGGMLMPSVLDQQTLSNH